VPCFLRIDMALCSMGARLTRRGLSALAGVLTAAGWQWLTLNLETEKSRNAGTATGQRDRLAGVFLSLSAAKP
jgi:hypothetical protein